MMKNKKLLAVSVFLLILILGFRNGCTPRLKEYKETRFYYDTYVSIQVYYPPDTAIQPIIAECWRTLETIQRLMSAHTETGDIARINTKGHEGTYVDKSVYRLLTDSLHFSSMTNGAFDITVLPLIQLWKEAAGKGKIPDNDTLLRIKDITGYSNIVLKEGHFVLLKKEGMKIDLGAIAKGYAVDEVARVLRQHGIKNFLIDAGGDMFCGGKNKGKRLWAIGLQDPKNKTSLLGTLRLSDKAVTTSGNYERFYPIDGHSYSHIIDPRTGYPQENVISATVVADSAEEADAYSTALCVLGGEEGLRLMETLPGLEALVIEERDGHIKKYISSGYEK